MDKRTDLAVEAHEIWQESAGETTELSGVRARDHQIRGVDLTVVEILDEEGVRSLGKPIGRYITIDLKPVKNRVPNSFYRTCEVFAEQLRLLLRLKNGMSVLVAGLGNAAVTPDAIGPKTLEHILITRHMVQHMPEHFSSFRPVCALAPGVLGTTGLESVEVVRSMVERAKPDCVIVIDALSAWNPERLCCTVQLSDTGIIPGSGVGNSREAFDKEHLGVPVISVGVPTVVEARTLAADLIERNGGNSACMDFSLNMIVTPTDIDASIRELARLIGCAINMALHEELSPDEISYYVG